MKQGGNGSTEGTRGQEGKRNQNQRGTTKPYGNQLPSNQAKNCIYRLYGDTFRAVNHAFRRHGLF